LGRFSGCTGATLFSYKILTAIPARNRPWYLSFAKTLSGLYFQSFPQAARRSYLLSNTVFGAPISLYRKHGFQTVTDGAHPVYARCNIVMELQL